MSIALRLDEATDEIGRAFGPASSYHLRKRWL